MLIATLIALLFLGSGTNMMLDGIDQMKDNIIDTIADESARKAALDVVEKLEDTANDYAEADSDDENELLQLIQQYETTTADLQKNMDASFDRRIQYQQEMLALRFELKDKLSREQWDKVFSSKVSDK
jgi:hypothetical protein